MSPVRAQRLFWQADVQSLPLRPSTTLTRATAVTAAMTDQGVLPLYLFCRPMIPIRIRRVLDLGDDLLDLDF